MQFEFNKIQKIIITALVLIVAAMVLFPPWSIHRGDYYYPTKYGFLFSSPIPPREGFYVTIDVTRLIFQIFFVALVGAGLVYIFKYINILLIHIKNLFYYKKNESIDDRIRRLSKNLDSKENKKNENK